MLTWQQAKGKFKAIHNPLAAARPNVPQPLVEPTESTSIPSSPADPSLFDPSIDPTTMAPTTLVLALRKQRREAKRLYRSEDRRSTMRASTLRTEAQLEERQRQEKDNPNRKGRRAQHEAGEVRMIRKMTQDELIAAALEEEERNKEDLRAWVRREEEKKELRRVGRKRVRGPRWTWISRTVGRLVEVVGEDGADKQKTVEVEVPSTALDAGRRNDNSAALDSVSGEAAASACIPASGAAMGSVITDDVPPIRNRPPILTETGALQGDVILPVTRAQGTSVSQLTAASTEEPLASSSTRPNLLTIPIIPQSALPLPKPTPELISGRYTRNYLILSQISGGLPAELAIVLGDHVNWDEVQFIPGRNRPISTLLIPILLLPLMYLDRRPVLCPFTGLPAKYRHPATNIPYATIEGYRQIEALLANRYVWSEFAGCWLGGEEDLCADGAEEVEGWKEAVSGGWIGGRQIRERKERIAEQEISDEADVERWPGKRRRTGRGTPGVEQGLVVPNKATAKGRGKIKGA